MLYHIKRNTAIYNVLYFPITVFYIHATFIFFDFFSPLYDSLLYLVCETYIINICINFNTDRCLYNGGPDET